MVVSEDRDHAFECISRTVQPTRQTSENTPHLNIERCSTAPRLLPDNAPWTFFGHRFLTGSVLLLTLWLVMMLWLTVHVLHVMQMSHPNQASGLQGRGGVSCNILAANIPGNGSGW